MEPQIQDLAERLGEAMAQSQAAAAYKRVRAESLADKDAQGLLKAYQDHLEALARKEHDRKPIEVDDKRKLQELQQKTASNDRLKALMKAQADYVELIQKVNDILGRHLVDRKPE